VGSVLNAEQPITILFICSRFIRDFKKRNLHRNEPILLCFSGMVQKQASQMPPTTKTTQSTTKRRENNQVKK
jgi:hypothetical protein